MRKWLEIRVHRGLQGGLDDSGIASVAAVV